MDMSPPNTAHRPAFAIPFASRTSSAAIASLISRGGSEHQATDELGGPGQCRIEGECCGGFSHRRTSILGAHSGRECIARSLEVIACERAAQCEVAIAVEVTLDAFAKLARRVEALVAIDVGCLHAQLVEV